jgi:hypothetical protein
MGEAAWERRLAANEFLDETHAPVVQPPGLYLVQVGVNSDQQGRGFGGCCCNPSFPRPKSRTSLAVSGRSSGTIAGSIVGTYSRGWPMRSSRIAGCGSEWSISARWHRHWTKQIQMPDAHGPVS